MQTVAVRQTILEAVSDLFTPNIYFRYLDDDSLEPKCPMGSFLVLDATFPMRDNELLHIQWKGEDLYRTVRPHWPAGYKILEAVNPAHISILVDYDNSGRKKYIGRVLGHFCYHSFLYIALEKKIDRLIEVSRPG